MHLRATFVIVYALALAGCDNAALEPVMSLSNAQIGQAEFESAGKDNCSITVESMIAGQAFYLYHSLPDQVEPPEPLQIDIETICGQFSREVTHVSGELLEVPLAAPLGAECGMTVTATIANSTIRCEVPSDATCGDRVADQCLAVDSTTDTGTDDTGTTGG